MRQTITFLIGSLVAANVVFANPISGASTRFVVHDRRESAPSGYVHSGAAPADRTLNLRINLAQSNINGLESKLLEVSTPSRPTYGQWLSSEEVEAYVKPTDATTSAVTSWLSSHGIQYKAITPAGDWFSLSVPVGKASEIFSSNFSIYTHVASGKQYVRTLEYSLPESLHGHINVVHPTTSFSGPLRKGPLVSVSKAVVPTVQPAESAAPAPDAVPLSCILNITPACLQALYNIPTTAATNKANLIGVAAFDDQYANKADLTSFLKKYRTDMSSSTSFSLTSVDGGTNSQTASQAGIEANLDIQYTVGLATNVPVTFISVGENTKDGADEGFLDIITALLGEAAPPQVLTTSYGFNTEADLSLSLTVALCNSYMQLAAKGVSNLFASGDGGVAATPGESCSKTFLPTFPTCPYVTLVGATENVPEKGAELSAGGFSNYFPLQSWQTSAVNAYLTTLGTEYSGKFNRTGRGYPDVSAQGERVSIILEGGTEQVAGTSCSSPIFASVIGLLNDELLNAGKPVLGYLNPWLYANPQAFNDITTGNNPGCGTNGFPATTGWDPVTGLGTPNYTKLRAAAGLS